MLAVTKSSRPEIMNGAFSCCCKLFRNWKQAGAAFDLDDRDEFVAAQTRQRVVVPERASKPFPQLTQHVVAGLMSERVVDLLEVIDVDEEQSRDVPLAMCRLSAVSRCSINIARFGNCVRLSR